MDVIRFFVEGVPMPQGSKAHVGKGVMIESADRKTNTRRTGGLKRWRQAVYIEARQAIKSGQFFSDEDPVAMSLIFSLPKPKSVKQMLPFRKPDVDKLARAVCDALSGTLYKDDARIVRLIASKRYCQKGEAPGVHVTCSLIRK